MLANNLFVFAVLLNITPSKILISLAILILLGLSIFPSINQKKQNPDNYSRTAACQCPEKPGVEQALSDAEIVFVGRALEVSESPIRANEIEAKFSIFRKIKGFEEFQEQLVPTKVIIYTPKENAKCGFTFATNQDYLIYAGGTLAHFKTDTCSRTIDLDHGLDELNQLIEIQSKQLEEKTASAE